MLLIRPSVYASHVQGRVFLAMHVHCARSRVSMVAIGQGHVFSC